MTQEEKSLLFKDLCARHPYGVKLQVRLDYGDNEHKEGTYNADIEAITSYNVEVMYYDTNMHGMARNWTFVYEEVKPYLRSLSSMTEEEKKEYKHLIAFSGSPDGAVNLVDWLNKKMFAYRTINGKNMFELGLALEAPNGMYNNK